MVLEGECRAKSNQKNRSELLQLNFVQTVILNRLPRLLKVLGDTECQIYIGCNATQLWDTGTEAQMGCMGGQNEDLEDL